MGEAQPSGLGRVVRLTQSLRVSLRTTKQLPSLSPKVGTHNSDTMLDAHTPELLLIVHSLEVEVGRIDHHKVARVDWHRLPALLLAPRRHLLRRGAESVDVLRDEFLERWLVVDQVREEGVSDGAD